MFCSKTFGERDVFHAEQNEKSKRFIQNAIELALSLGDFQKELNARCTPQDILEHTAQRVAKLISFEVSAIYRIEDDSDIHLAVCTPAADQSRIDNEVDFLINNGFMAWAIRERRGVTVYSKDGSRQIMLHVLSTYSRIRGVFVGIFPPGLKRLPESALEILSIILRNAANSMESLILSSLLQEEKTKLERSVADQSSKLIQFERQLMQAQKMQAIAALAGGVAHQFNNALTGLIGNLDLIQLKLADNSEISAYLERTRSLTGRMTHLTSQLLAYAQGGKYTAGKVSLKKMLTDLEPSLRRLVKPTVRLQVDSPEEDWVATVDVTQLQLVIKAIVTNADDAIDADGQVRVSVARLWLQASQTDNGEPFKPGWYVRIRICDTGSGMDPDTLNRVFEPFFSTRFEGRGLSMAAALGIIKNHNGWISLDSQVGQGTDVQIYLPCV
jgi:signal transduction histidine kinase